MQNQLVTQAREMYESLDWQDDVTEQVENMRAEARARASMCGVTPYDLLALAFADEWEDE